MKTRLKTREATTILELSGHLMGGPDYGRLMGQIESLLVAGKRDFLLDFSCVTWIDSTGVGILVSARDAVVRSGGRLAICGLNDRVLSVYYFMQLDTLFSRYDRVDQALGAIHQRALDA